MTEIVLTMNEHSCSWGPWLLESIQAVAEQLLFKAETLCSLSFEDEKSETDHHIMPIKWDLSKICSCTG